jgi:hypothetical protein
MFTSLCSEYSVSYLDGASSLTLDLTQDRYACHAQNVVTLGEEPDCIVRAIAENGLVLSVLDVPIPEVLRVYSATRHTASVGIRQPSFCILRTLAVHATIVLPHNRNNTSLTANHMMHVKKGECAN